MKHPSYLLSAQTILREYKFPEPFYLFFKNYCKVNKQFGSRDRKIISALLFGFFKLGKQDHIPVENAMQIGAFISVNLPLDFYQKNFTLGIEQYSLPLAEKIEWLQTQGFRIAETQLPEVCAQQSYQDIWEDILGQHHTFIRVRKNKKIIVEALQNQEAAYTIVSENCISFPEHTSISTILPDANNYEVQDLHSQAVCDFFAATPKQKIWDCCAASGGKSIAMFDACPQVELFVSDIRYQILESLKTRFAKAGIKKYQVFPHNAQVPTPYANNNMGHGSFDQIIIDAPCTGSGTWARSPEQFYFSNDIDIEFYAQRQLDILTNTWPFLQKGGTAYYITCSAFSVENDEVIGKFLTNTIDADCTHQQFFAGAENNADSMFIAVLKKG